MRRNIFLSLTICFLVGCKPKLINSSLDNISSSNKFSMSEVKSKVLPIKISNSDLDKYNFQLFPKKCVININNNCRFIESFEWSMHDSGSNEVGVKGIQKFLNEFNKIGAKLIKKERSDSGIRNYIYEYKNKFYYVQWSGVNGDVDLTITNKYE